MKIYFAGRISATDWRHTIVGRQRLRSALGTDDIRATEGHYHESVAIGSWGDLTITGDGTSLLGLHEYVGPFFVGCDHRCAHQPTTHGVGPGGCVQEYSDSHQYVFDSCCASLKRADLVFAWIDDLLAFGTLWELGYAHAHGKKIVVAKPPAFEPAELWLGLQPVLLLNAFDAVSGFKAYLDQAEGRTVSGVEGRADSPIETKLLNELRQRWFTEFVPDRKAWRHKDLWLAPQFEVVGTRYALDLAIWCDATTLRIGIECDGHAFHEKTKEQAARDKSRDRLLTLKGWTMVRFTGSEIYRDPVGCANQVMEIVLSRLTT